MPGKIELYFRNEPPCPYCKKAKALLESKQIKYTGYEIGKDISRDDVLAKFPNAKTVPIVTLNGAHIGGYDQLAQFIKQHNVMGENYGTSNQGF